MISISMSLVFAALAFVAIRRTGLWGGIGAFAVAALLITTGAEGLPWQMVSTLMEMLENMLTQVAAWGSELLS